MVVQKNQHSWARLVEDNLRLVEHIVNRMQPRLPPTAEREDLVAAGRLALVEAAARYDPDRGVGFASFAGRRIEGALVDHVRQGDWVPRRVRSNARRLAETEAALTASTGRMPDDDALAAAMEQPIEKIRALRRQVALGALVSLDHRVGVDDETTLIDLVVGPTDPTTAELEEREAVAYLRDAVAVLPERLRLVVIGYFFEGLTTEELGQRLGVTQSRVSQLKQEAIGLMRAGLDRQYSDTAGAPGGPTTERGGSRIDHYAGALDAASTWRARIGATPPAASSGPAS